MAPNVFTAATAAMLTVATLATPSVPLTSTANNSAAAIARAHRLPVAALNESITPEANVSYPMYPDFWDFHRVHGARHDELLAAANANGTVIELIPAPPPPAEHREKVPRKFGESPIGHGGPDGGGPGPSYPSLINPLTWNEWKLTKKCCSIHTIGVYCNLSAFQLPVLCCAGAGLDIQCMNNGL